MAGQVIILILLVLWEVILVAMILAMELEILKKNLLAGGAEAGREA